MGCPSEYNFCRVRGDTEAESITITSDGTTPINITGDTFLLTVDPQPEPTSSGSNLYQLTGTIISGPAGTVAFAPSTPQAASAPGVYYYDIQWTRTGSGGGAIKTILKGTWTINQDITK